jgi:2-enoate reductase
MYFESLFRPITIGTIEVKNRIVFAPIGIGAYNEDETVNPDYFPFIRERAKETGLIITQGTRPSKKGGVKLIGCYDDRFIPSLKLFANSAHHEGARIFLQLVVIGGNDPLGGYAPSVLDIPLYRNQWGRGAEYKPKELTVDQIKELVEEFAYGARRAMEAGFDGVEVHGAYGYLLSEFICPATNRRTDEYGGNQENRMRFPVEIIRRIKEVCGSTFPIGFKFNAHQEIQPESIDEELGVRNAMVVAKEGIAYLHEVAMGEDVMYMQLAKYPSMPTMYQPRNTTVRLAENLKRRILDVPIIAAGGITRPQEADEIIRDQKADLVAVGRALLADPHWSWKAKRGIRITPCIRCLVCHNEVVKHGTYAACTVNPYLVREDEQPLVPAQIRKKVLVAGGGPAGITAAVMASRRGHTVTLYEKGEQLGGTIIAGSVPEFKYEFRELLNYFQEEVESSEVEIKLKTEATAELIRSGQPDALIVAIGGRPIRPAIPGIGLDLVVNAPDALLRADEHRDSDVVVIGGGDVGCETAIVLRRNGNRVSIVERLDELMALVEMKYHVMVMERMLKEEGVHVYTCAQVAEIKRDAVVVEYNEGRKHELPADLVVIAVGVGTDTASIKKLAGSCPVSYVIGDAQEPRTIREAVFEGDRVGRLL